MNNYTDPNDNTTSLRSTCVITMKSRQRRMLDFFKLPGTIYLGIGRRTPWTDPVDPTIDDTKPPVPSVYATQVDDLIGVQKVEYKYFGKPLEEPTTEQKQNGIYYKGVYYETTTDEDKAINEGFTSVLLEVTLDRDTWFPVNITYRQLGIFTQVNSTAFYLSANDFYALPQVDRGILEIIDNRRPQTRAEDQQETITVGIDF